MADNYLENKMEEHRLRQSGALHGAPARRHTATTPDGAEGKITVSYPVGLRVFVTGGASGIGRAIVKAFRTIGARVDFVDIDRTRGTQLAQACGARFIPADVSKPELLLAAVKRSLADRGDIDIVVNNAGLFESRDLRDADWHRFDYIMNVNLRPAVIIASELARHRSTMGEPNPYGGRIINIASTRADASEIGTEAYVASKGGLRSLTHSLMRSLAPWRITVNSISPSWVETKEARDDADTDPALPPSGRLGKPEDIARLALFLAHPTSDFINGTDIVADGGARGASRN